MSRSGTKSKGRGKGRRDGTDLTLGSLTHVGMVRSANQDAYCAMLAPNAPLETDALLAVADGMGGHQAGEVASTMAIKGLVRHLSSPGVGDVTPLPGGGHANLLREVIEKVNVEVSQAALRPETRGMGTTQVHSLAVGRQMEEGTSIWQAPLISEWTFLILLTTIIRLVLRYGSSFQVIMMHRQIQ